MLVQNTGMKKRGRKPKKLINDNINVIMTVNEDLTDANTATDIETNTDTEVKTDIDPEINIEEIEKPIAKKRGRKPKGGKIIQQILETNNNYETKTNVILHLKCFFKDLNNLTLTENIESFNFSTINQIGYTNDFNNNKIKTTQIEEDDSDDEYKENNTKEIYKKLKILEHNLHTNNISDKKSACFWCTYEFDNPTIYIPKHFIKNTYHVYGCFCSPECATAYLMEENIDNSSKFERYHLINNIYTKIYDYKKNIKPAPNPYYMLNKYYGNLSIQEYRSLLKNDRLFLIVEKPLTRILPELHEDNDNFIINNTLIHSNANNFQLKKKNVLKKQTKTTILSENFGLS